MASPFESFVQTELPKRPFLPEDVASETVLIRRGAAPRQMEAVVLKEGEVLGMIDGMLAGIVPNTGPTIDAVVHVQRYTSNRWTIAHNRNNVNVQISLYDAEGREFEPNIIQIGMNSVTVNLVEPALGRAVLIFAPASEEYSFEPDEVIGDVTSVVQAPDVVRNAEANAVAVRDNDTLLTGLNYRNGGLSKTYNNHVEVATGVRYSEIAETIQSDTDGNYVVNIADDRRWSYVISAALVDQAYGTVLSNFYDLRVTIHEISSGNEAVLELQRTGNTFVMRDLESGRTVPVVYTSNLGVVQDVRDLDFFDGVFTGQRNAVGGLLGGYRVTVACTPRPGVTGEVLTDTIVIDAVTEPRV